MTDREKVMRGLESHANSKVCKTCVGDECPYYNLGGSYPKITCSCILAAEALALLREREARVMTLEEVKDSDDWMWIEYLSGYVEWNKQSDIYGYYEDGVMWNDATFDCNDYYGIEWRCWTSRPTEEQMRETPWEREEESK